MIKVNDFVVKFANVNGSGSASANLMFAKSIFRMGIPVTPKNIFPSNIQGLPTWFEVRISKDGYAARREGIDCFITLNPQTYQTDMKEIFTENTYDELKEILQNWLNPSDDVQEESVGTKEDTTESKSTEKTTSADTTKVTNVSDAFDELFNS